MTNRASAAEALLVALPGGDTRRLTDRSAGGVAHGVQLPGEELFFSHAHLHGGPAPVRRFLPELIDLIRLELAQTLLLKNRPIQEIVVDLGFGVLGAGDRTAQSDQSHDGAG